jgi:membrane-anchored protein YejM (alkaline phosphatase superfamily)
MYVTRRTKSATERGAGSRSDQSVVLIRAIWAQFLDGGLGAAMYIATSFVASLGIIAVFIGLLITFPYAFFVQSHLYGRFARITDAAAR